MKRLIVILVFALPWGLPSLSADGRFGVVSPLCEGHTNPLGVEESHPRFSWQVESDERGWIQGAYRIQVSSSLNALERGDADVWDSGKVDSEKSVHVPFAGSVLASGQTYYWKVKVWEREGDRFAWSQPGSWTMGFLHPGDWQARWIQNPLRLDQVMPVFRKEFSLKKPVKRALVYVSGLGQYELFLNGGKVGDHFLAPAWSNYHDTVFYNVFDVTGQLESENCLGIMLGNGFYRVDRVSDRYTKLGTNFGKLQTILQLELEYVDGTRERIITDNTWRTTGGPIVFSNIFGGEDFDARLAMEGWTSVGFEDGSWRKADISVTPSGRFRAQYSEPVKAMESFEPVSVSEVKPGVWVYDMGQNASALPRIAVRGPAGSMVSIAYGEQLYDDGTVNQEAITHKRSLQGMPSVMHYTLSGKGIETWQPQFFYSGYQYLQVEGATPPAQAADAGVPQLLSIESVHVRYAGETSGGFECSNDLFNQIYRLNDWAVKSNLQHVLTDCPHREKLGWLEVAHLMAPSILFRYDGDDFYRKFMGDIRDVQSPDGLVPTTAPDYNRHHFSWQFTFGPEWASAAVIIPWYHYLWYGDERMLHENYTSIKALVDYLERHSDRHLIVDSGLGDWCDWDVSTTRGGRSKFTTNSYVSTAIQVYICTLLSEAATVLGKVEDVSYYDDLAEKTKSRLREEFYHSERSSFDRHSQTANAMALYMDIALPEERAGVLESLLGDIESRKSDDPELDHRQTSGDVGHRFLIQALNNAGRSDVLFEMTNRRGRGSYGSVIDAGLTSMAETWDIHKTASLNHCMLGHIMEWFQSGLGGIKPDPESPGLKHFLVEPQIVEELDWVKTYHKSPYGIIVSDWKRVEEDLQFNITVPANTVASVVLPVSSDRISDRGKPIQEAEGVHSVTEEGGQTVLALGSGDYQMLAR